MIGGVHGNEFRELQNVSIRNQSAETPATLNASGTHEH